MKYRLIIRPEAERDLNEGFSWCEEKRKGLGYDFVLQVDAGIKFIQRNPEIHQIGYKNTRKHLIRKFPYKIIYLVDIDRVVILGIIHGKRSPDFVKKRIVNTNN
jgi:toxin ParE1/3/4